MDPFLNQMAAPPEQLKPFPAATPVVLGMSLDDLVKGRTTQRIILAKGGLEHRFKTVKAAK